MNPENFFKSVLKTTFFVVMIVLFWFIGVKLPPPTESAKNNKLPTTPILIQGHKTDVKDLTRTFSFKIPLGSQENQIGFMSYQEKVPPGYAQGAFPTEFFRDAEGIIWIGDPYGPRLTAWNDAGDYLDSIDLSFLRNDASQLEKEIVGYTVHPASNGDWVVLNSQNKKIYWVNPKGKVNHILSIPLRLSDNRIVMNISPFFQWIDEQWIFVTVETTQQPYASTKGFSGGDYIETAWESFFLSIEGDIVGPVSEQLSVLPLEEGFLGWSIQNQALTLEWFADPRQMTHPKKSWKIDPVEWHYGGMIGTDQLDRIYFWADQDLIGRIHLRWGEISYFHLPEQNVFPVTVTPEGDIGYIRAGKQFLQVEFMKMTD